MVLTEAQFERAARQEEAQARLATLYRMSSGALHALLAGDPAEALVWVRAAAQAGFPAAQVRLGRMLLEGAGTPPDARGAYAWFARAARNGDSEAMNMEGRCHENGWGVPVDLERAAASYRASAEAGHDWGRYNLGNLLFDGLGIASDPPQALRWFLLAASQGHARAMNLVGRCLEEGWGCRRDCEQAGYWYGRSAESGYFRGQFNHALVLMERGAPQRAAEWLWRAACGGDHAMRTAIEAVLAATQHPALCRVRARLLALRVEAGGAAPEPRAISR